MIPFPKDTYHVILADPPWSYGKTYNKSASGCRLTYYKDFPYQTMSLDELKDLPIREISKKDCHLYLWVTNRHLPFAFDLMSSWGFDYKSIAFIWHKITKNGKNASTLTCYAKECCEIVLVGTKGKVVCLLKDGDRSVQQYLKATRKLHSQKPEELQNRLDRMYPNKNKIELFARRHRENWTVWGNETNKFPPYCKDMFKELK